MRNSSSLLLPARDRRFAREGYAYLAWLGECACLFFLGGCASTAIITRADEIARTVEAATQRGARECAPQELALAKVNLEFAHLELSQGDQRRADHHLTLAEPNAKAALRVANDGECRGAAAQRTVEASPGASERLIEASPGASERLIEASPGASERSAAAHPWAREPSLAAGPDEGAP